MHPEKRAKKKELVEMFTLLIMVYSIMDDSSFHSSEINGLCLMKLCLVQNLKFATVLIKENPSKVL